MSWRGGAPVGFQQSQARPSNSERSCASWGGETSSVTDGAESRPPPEEGGSVTVAPLQREPSEAVGDNCAGTTSVSSASGAQSDSWNPNSFSVEASRQPIASVAASRQNGPTDDEILAQENLIRAVEAEKLAFVGDAEPLSALEDEYRAGSGVFLAKIKMLEASYEAIRRARGDGNCFFRSFIFAYLETLVTRNDTAERTRMIHAIKGWTDKLLKTGYQQLVFEDAQETLLDQLNTIGGADPLTVQALEANMREATISNMIVMFLRMLTSCEIQMREDFFAPFIMGMSDELMGVEQFCRRCVEPMGEESDHVHIVALTNALQVPIRVVYLDNSTGGDGTQLNHHDFVPDELAGKPAGVPRVHLLYRPGHYDILYMRLPAANSVA